MRRSALALLCAGALLTGVAGIYYLSTSHSPAVAQTSYPPLRITFEAGEPVFHGWAKLNDKEWTAREGDPAAPHYLSLDHGPQEVAPEKAFQEGVKRLKVSGVRDIHSREIEVWDVISRKGGRAWATAATARVGDTEMSLFAQTSLNKRSNRYTTDFFVMPTQSYREWGGVMTFLDNFGVSPYMEALPEGFAEAARTATTAEQVEIYARLVDLTVTQSVMGVINANNAALQALEGVGRDINTRTDCMMTPNCEFVPGALPGQGRTSIGGK